MMRLLSSGALTRFIAVFAVSLLTVVARGESETPANPPARPNVLFIAIDDLRPQLGAYGDPHIKTPELDEFAQTATVFGRAYCQQPICMASRASLMTGYRPDHGRIYSCLPVEELLPDAVTMNRWFEQQGYTFISAGKIYHYNEDNKAQFEGRHYVPKGDWVGRYYLKPENVRIVEQRLADETLERKDRSRGPAYESADVEDDAYFDGKIAAFGVEQLESLAARGADAPPFFLAIGFRKPHLPFNAPKKYWDLYDPDELPKADNPYLPENATAYTAFTSGEVRTYLGVPKDRELPLPDELGRNLVHGYLACTSYVDAQVGLVFETLERTGLAENTIVVIWGDHGWKLGEHGMWGKHTPLELDARVPLMIRTPVGTPGFETGYATGLVETVDLYPTLCDLTGVPTPDHVQGRSLRPLLEDPSHPGKAAAYTEWPKHDRAKPEKTITGLSMKTDRYRYIEWTRRSTGEVLATELYDHEADPDENHNVAGDPANAGVVAELSRLLDQGKGWRQLPPW